jgi:hypothetical protein
VRNLHCSFLLLFTVPCLRWPALAQQQKRTEAEQVGLTGPVKSTSTIATRTDVHWQQPGGPTVIMPIWCWECEFDRDGNKIRSGQMLEGSFHGESIRIIRDANSQVTERVVEDPANGAPLRHEIIGPYGKIQ